MSIYSMTGFGRSEFRTPNGPARVEIRSTNQKYFEVACRVPSDLMPYTEKIRKIVQARVRRGKIHLNISAADGGLTPGHVHLNESAAKEYHRALVRISKSLHLREEVSAAQIARMPDVLTRTVFSSDIDRTWDQARKAIEKALKLFVQSRKSEGTALKRDLSARIRLIASAAGRIRRRAPRVVAEYRKRALLRTEKPAAHQGRERLLQETAAFARNCDITEELVRLRSHTDSFRKTLIAGGEIGRKMDFICQEIMRETNTIGSKSNDYRISEDVIRIKSELEKIREQSLNVE